MTRHGLVVQMPIGEIVGGLGERARKSANVFTPEMRGSSLPSWRRSGCDGSGHAAVRKWSRTGLPCSGSPLRLPPIEVLKIYEAGFGDFAVAGA